MSLPPLSLFSSFQPMMLLFLLLHLPLLILTTADASLPENFAQNVSLSTSSSFPRFQVSPISTRSEFLKLQEGPENSAASVINGTGFTSNATGLAFPKVLIRGNSTILTKNRTFELGFFSTNGGASWYLSMRFALIPTPTYVWVANRERPIKNLASSTLEITEAGRLAVNDSGVIIWQSTNTEIGAEMDLLESGNLILLTQSGGISWQSFDYPSDTWLPGMNLTKDKYLTSWRSLSDPSPGLYSLRLKQPAYGEFELVFNGTKPYWNTGNWTGDSFINVPEMTIPYIYLFHFDDSFKPTASFGFTERPLYNGLLPPLTRFQIDYTGLLSQYTWSVQTENWNMFWSQPDNRCRVYGLCGKFGICNSKTLNPCECLTGYSPVDKMQWDSGDFSGGCGREGASLCEENDEFEEVDVVGFEGADIESFSSTSRNLCERNCLGNCSCIGLSYIGGTNLCKNFYGSLLNLRNFSSDNTGAEELYVRVQEGASVKKKKKMLNTSVMTASIVGSIAVLGFMGVIVLVLLRKRQSGDGAEEDGGFPLLHLKMFSYKELQVATRGFSEKIGHGGFGTVFQGELTDSTIVAVKRLERPGSGEKEFRAEVSTIGNIQHVNLVRLRGFCSENSHRLLVYDYMPNGPLSMYLRQEGPILSWDFRFRVAIGTARGITYLHEECRDCIIHCDIKPENILLDSDFSAKVSDFGLAKLIGRDFSRVLATMRGTWGYVAPEWISGVAITTKADVYSYGMTLLELIGGRRNVETPPSGETGNKWFFPPWAAQQIIKGNFAAVVDTRLGNAYNISEVERVALVAVWCIQDDEESRPTMGMAVKMLEGVVPVAVPPPPKLLQALVSGESFHGVKTHSDNIASTGGSFGHDNVEVSNGDSESSLGNISSSPVNVKENV